MAHRGVNATDAHYKGASNELKAAAYYLARGNQVYFPTMQQGVVDFVVDVDGTLQRVQVKTASLNNGYIQCRLARGATDPKYGPDAFQILFVVYENRMWLIPWCEIKSTNICLDKPDGSYSPYGRDWSDYEIIED